MRYLRILSLKLSSSFRTTPQKFALTPSKPRKFPFLGFFQPEFLRHFSSPAQESKPNKPEKVSAIVEEISGLTLLEVADLTELLRKKLGVHEMPIVSVMMPGMGFSLRGMGTGASAKTAGGEVAQAAEQEEKTSFDLKLEAGFEPAAKIKIIKEVRSCTDLGLKEAKDLVEKAPTLLKKGVPKVEAEKIIEKMKELGRLFKASNPGEAQRGMKRSLL
ncbi:hypothetical protein Nepgr_016728 [Nepenthes gracilis]|uniref:Uncharacterized protein n=1 Tax=Nepenthes gracilis TaxID=150966 RepID=A0AAD3SPV5_NEPGR|nr:hypothetical protein Nepgr_016728 [Nepenthes gracilis]